MISKSTVSIAHKVDMANFATAAAQSTEKLLETKDSEKKVDKSFSVSVINLSFQLWLITLTLTLIILDVTKTSSNNNYLVLFHYCVMHFAI